MQIVLFGDSLMAGYGISKPHHLSEVLKLELKNLKIESEVINASVSGDTTRGGLNRIQWTLQDKADLIVLGLGANDMLRGIEPKEIKENLNQIIKNIKNKIYLLFLLDLLRLTVMRKIIKKLLMIFIDHFPKNII
jgi:acyl-CoA thioesterase I